jgi:hypothetical protein
MSGIMFNEDCNHFIYSRYKEGIKVSAKELNEFIDQYSGTQVKEFVMNINAMLAWFPAQSRENAIDKYQKCVDKNINQENEVDYLKLSLDIFVEQGLDMYKIWIDRLRENAISPWISIRMNDIHNTDDDNHFLVTQFYRNNKHMSRASHRPHSHYFDNALDYSFPEVREHYLSLIREVVDRYDFDGLELDWMREPVSMGIGRELDGINIFTGFMREVRSVLDDAEKTKGHEIKISVRIPFSPEVALRFGFDVINWAKSGIVDVIIPTARWVSTDNDMPIDLWKQVLSDTDVMICAGLELLIGASPIVPWSADALQYNSIETVRGSAVTYLSMGAERIYLYNYMDCPSIPKEDSMEEGSAIDPRYYNLLLTTIGDIETAVNLNRRHITTYHDINAPGMRNGNLLPFNCNPPDINGLYDFHDVRVATGPILLNSEVTLAIGVDSQNDLEASDFSVYVNRRICIFKGNFKTSKPGPDCKMYFFKIEGNDNFPDASIIEIASNRNLFTVKWVEILVQSI